MTRRTDIWAAFPESLADADEALTRYGRWAADRSRNNRRCASAEGLYQGESWQAVERRRSPAPVAMLAADAMLCQRALVRVPDRERMVLNILYIPKSKPPEAQLRILRIPPQLCQVRHLAGLRMFDNLHKALQHQRESALA